MPPFHFWTERPLRSVTVTPLARNIEAWQACCDFKLFVASLLRFHPFFCTRYYGIQWFSASRSLKTWLKWRNVGTMKHPVCLQESNTFKLDLEAGLLSGFFFFWQFVYVTATATVLMSFWVCEISTEKDHSYQLKLRDGIQYPYPVSCWVEEMIRVWRSQKGFMRFNLYPFMSATK